MKKKIDAKTLKTVKGGTLGLLFGGGGCGGGGYGGGKSGKGCC